jgi:hypothetical protein
VRSTVTAVDGLILESACSAARVGSTGVVSSGAVLASSLRFSVLWLTELPSLD